jgi:sterol desaturase/sphingolipid hydroxylase (fatty acid hydroxylase superfamily)
MSGLKFENAIYSWVIFWGTYWITGIYLTWKAKDIRPVKKLSKVLNQLVLNMIWTFLGTICIFYLPIKIDTDLNITIKLILCNFITEIWFYHVHVMVHQQQLYKKLHKLHHEFKYPYALTALYCTWYEAVLCNLFSVALGPVMLTIPPPYLYIWMGLVALNATFTHSGLRLGWLMDGSHDIHHETFKYNFGTLTILDRIYGTYKEPYPIQDDSSDDTEGLNYSKQ